MNEKTRLLVNQNPNRIQLINKNEEDEAVCYGYRSNAFLKVLFFLLLIGSAGTIMLFFYWKPKWKLYLIATKCDLSKAEFVLIEDHYKRSAVIKIKTISNQESSLERSDKSEYGSTESSYQSFPDSMNQSFVNDMESSNRNLVSPNGGGTGSSKKSSKKSRPNPNEIKYFRYHMIRYAWNQGRRSFEKIYGLDHGTSCHRLLNEFKGYPNQIQEAKLKFYGENSIEVKVKSYVRLFFEEVLTPFYIFQIMACTLWIIDDYFLYAACIMGISLISIIVSLIETKRQSQTLHDMVKTNYKVRVCRGGDVFEEVPCEQLVPGDVIAIPSNHSSVMTCDAVLLNGTCILNESMLTGESVPVVKSPLPVPENLQEIFNIEAHKRNTLFNGTTVVQTRNYDGSPVLAVVIRTGFNTAKGELVRGILFPKPMGFKFYEDSLKFILFLFSVAIVGMGYGVAVLANKGVHVRDLVIRALDIVTIVVPPALPAAMTVGTVYAQSRLKKKLIYCISPPRINVGGKLKLICFDKTGTLTEDGLDIWGVLGIDKTTEFKHPIHDIENGLEDGPLLRTLATCHSLSRYEGALTGDPLDVKMFESTRWEFVDEPVANTNPGTFEQVCPMVRKPKRWHANDVPEEIAIVKQFTFSSSFLRMSVLCRSSHGRCMEVYSKGAPEKIVELCKTRTVPNDFHEILKIYTANGYRVIALAGKCLPENVSWHTATKYTRDQIESDLDFYGMLVLQNAIKPETTGIINELTQAGLTTLMVTGDNLLTALCVARKCGMIPKWNKVIIIEAHAEQEPEDLDTAAADGLAIARASKVPARIEWKMADETVDLDNLDTNTLHHANPPDIQSVINVSPTQDSYNFAMTGKTFGILRKSFPKILEKILVNGTVYARMSPDQKAQLVEHLISIGYCVSMCGDGANDTIALKAAHVGISLSEAEASVASPFTSKIQNISCVPEVIKEGRAALVTSFGVFKYMALYSMIQFISVLILYSSMTNLADEQFLYIDLLLITPVAVFMSANKAYEKLSKKRPLGSLVGFVNICSIIFQIMIVILFQLLVFFYLVKQSWYKPNDADKDNFKKNVNTMEGTVVFLMSTFQYVIMAFVYSRGPPFRQGIINNFWFVFSLVVLTALNIWITLAPLPEIRDLLSMRELDPGKDISLFRINIVFIAIIFFILSYSIEELLVNSGWFKRLGKVITRKKHPKNKYKILKQEIEKDPHWPYIGRITFEK